MDKFEKAKESIDKEFKVNPLELQHFKDNKCQLTYREKWDVVWLIDVELMPDRKNMKVTYIRRESILKVK